jgi:hypothetical protein
MRTPTLCIAAALGLVGCAGPVAQNLTTPPARQSVHAPSPSASSASKRPVTLVVADDSPPSQPVTIHFLSESGSESGHLQLSAGTRILAAGGGRIFVATGDGTLKALRLDGSGVTLDSSTSYGFGPVIVTRDGTHWAWSTSIQGTDSFQTQVKVASEGSLPRVVLNRTDGKGALQPFAWTPSGIYINPLPMDAIGYFPFQGPVVLGLMELLNPATGASTPVPTVGDCTFSDVSDAGVIACYPTTPKPKLRLVYSPGNVLDLDLATPRFNHLGDAFFSRDSTMLTVAGATGVGMPAEFSGGVQPKPEVYGVDLVRVLDGSIRRFGPGGVRVAMGEESWLPDGKLVLWRPVGAAGGDAGLYVLDPSGSGQGPLIPTTARPIGYLTTP